MAMEHYLIRATIIPEIVKMIEKEYHLPEREALKAFYMSATGAAPACSRAAKAPAMPEA